MMTVCLSPSARGRRSFISADKKHPRRFGTDVRTVELTINYEASFGNAAITLREACTRLSMR